MNGSFNLLFVWIVDLRLLHLRSECLEEPTGVEASVLQSSLFLPQLLKKLVLVFVDLGEILFAGLLKIRQRSVVPRDDPRGLRVHVFKVAVRVFLDKELQGRALHHQVVLHARRREALGLAKPATLSIFRTSHELVLQLAHLLDA